MEYQQSTTVFSLVYFFFPLSFQSKKKKKKQKERKKEKGGKRGDIYIRMVQIVRKNAYQ
jgi:hypothetical protein